nr:hypothetical protein [Tanacetum cinerariifolium]
SFPSLDEVSEREGESDEEETRQEEEESFDPIPRTPEGNSHVTLTPVHPDGSQESSSVSSFVTSMLKPISDAGVESIFTTASSSIVSDRVTDSPYREVLDDQRT